MNRYKIELQYLGKNYHGWQKQPNAHTVQAEIESKLNQLMQQEIEIIGCGRTDTGVHASHYAAHFDFDESVDCSKIKISLNRMLPADISILSIYEVASDFHARFSAVSREYKYFIDFEKSAFRGDIAWNNRVDLDFNILANACEIIKNHKHFTAFCKGEIPNNSDVCIIHEAIWEQTEMGLIFTVKANRFLRNMVRAMVGTLIEVGTKKISIQQFQEILNSGTRSDAGKSVPAHGLFLTKVEY
jgi:tRNA pseudouridine38-40 synthase